jgi:acetoin utilization protein AcuB
MLMGRGHVERKPGHLAPFLLYPDGMSAPLIEAFMTRSPHTIGDEQTLATARHSMRESNIRHLPVLAGGKLVGILSDRDLDSIETLRDVDPKTLSVAQAMSQSVFSVSPQTPVRQVVREMIENKYGSAVIQDHGHVVGVFTTIDALHVLLDVLDEKSEKA